MTDYSKIKADVDAYLAENGITYVVRYVGETTRDEEWQCDQWRITLTGKSAKIETDYFTGLGRRKPVKGAPKNTANKNTIASKSWERHYLKPVTPLAADMLHSLVLESSAVDMSFVDWCADYGYNDDSRKALAMYEACCQVGLDLRKLLTHDQRETLREMLQDY